ncbi:MAG: aldolase catalytic domain-containing protein [Lachnospiraceae bacterium]|nr:aldolase catalytic domain-containing protein [Lachnospiraceae bacterium]
MGQINLLDCTLRDGGYVNDWAFGRDNMMHVFERLVSAGVDIIEVGFLDERRPFDADRSIMPDCKAVNEIYGRLDKGGSMAVGMIDYGTCGVDRLLPAKDCFLDGIRVIFKKQKMYEAIAFCKQVKDMGYKVFVQAVSITSYGDEELKELIALVNELEPYAFSLVDTYGLLHKGDLQHYFVMANEHLKPTIGIGYHAHNNFQLAYSNCIELLENPVERMLLVDGTLYGMGKSAGNAAIELLAMYMNQKLNKTYHISQLLEAIDVTILDIYRQIPWGYHFKFYLSALNDCHPNYVSYLMNKKKLSVKSINEILASLEGEKKLLYDEKYAEELYIDYQKRECDDREAISRLKELIAGRKVLLLAPGNHIIAQKDRVDEYIIRENPFVIAVNFLPDEYRADAVFMSNAKRYVQLSTKLLNSKDILTMATSNVTKAEGRFDYLFNYSPLLDEEAMIVDNPMIMLIRLLASVNVDDIALAGFDGYTKAEKPDYVNPNMAHTFSKTKALEINEDVIQSLGRYAKPSQMQFITDSLYTE